MTTINTDTKKLYISIVFLTTLFAGNKSNCMLQIKKIIPTIKAFSVLKQTYNSSNNISQKYFSINKKIPSKSNRFFNSLRCEDFIETINLTKKINLNTIKDEQEKRPLELAYEKNNPELIKFFIENGAQDNNLLFRVCLEDKSGDKLEILKIMLKNSPKDTINNPCLQKWTNYIVGIPFYSERSLLWLACATCNKEIVEYLLLNGAKTNNKIIEELKLITSRFCKDPVKKRNIFAIEKYLNWTQEYNSTLDKEELINKYKHDKYAFAFLTELNKKC